MPDCGLRRLRDDIRVSHIWHAEDRCMICAYLSGVLGQISLGKAPSHLHAPMKLKSKVCVGFFP